jgi:hypothetical protein
MAAGIRVADVIDELCEHIANGNSITKACTMPGMPIASTVFSEMRRNEAIRAKIDEARDWAEKLLVEQVQVEHEKLNVAVNDEKVQPAAVQAIRAREQGLRWMLSRRHPEKYGDKVEVKSNGPGFVGIVHTRAPDSE